MGNCLCIRNMPQIERKWLEKVAKKSNQHSVVSHSAKEAHRLVGVRSREGCNCLVRITRPVRPAFGLRKLGGADSSVLLAR